MNKLKDKKWCNKQYWDLERSIGDIAKELDTYPNKVRRALKSHGIKLRDKGSAQAVALKKGRSSHPTKDKGHSEEAKLKISEGVAQNWENLSYEELEASKDILDRAGFKAPDKHLHLHKGDIKVSIDLS